MSTAPIKLTQGTARASDLAPDREPDILDSLRHLIPLSRLRDLIPSRQADKSVHAATLTRWILRGVRGRDGSRVRLKAVKLAGAWLTTRDWVSEFVEATMASNEHDKKPTVSMAGGVTSPVLRMSPVRRRAAEQAQRELARLGMGA